MVFNTLLNVNNFPKVILGEYNNTCDIENSSTKERYINTDLPNYKTSSFDLTFMDNILLNKYYEKIKSKSTKRILTKEEQIKYRYRPEALAGDVFKVPGLWYLILKLNSCEDFSEFHDIK